MGIFSGILCLICFCLLSAKAVTAKLHLKRLDRILMKVHKPVSVFLIIIYIVHIFYVIPILKNRDLLVVISGSVSVVFMVLLICLCHVIKDRKKKVLWHRILTILMAIGIAGHFAAYIVDFNNYQKKVANIEVEIKDGEIVSISLLEHRNERGKRAEDIIDNVIAEQKIDVDAISGANLKGVLQSQIQHLQNEKTAYIHVI